MSTTITLPDIGMSPVRFGLWLVEPGESVFEGDRLAEVLIPGLLVDVLAPVSGVLRERWVCSGDDLRVGQVLGTLDSNG